MSSIERTIQVTFEHRVHFTRSVFSPDNRLLHDLLTKPGKSSKALVVLDESLALPLSRSIEDYFSAFGDSLKLVCSPLLVEGGERAKNSWFYVSEIHSRVERHGLDRHSYILGVGGGALLDVTGLAAATAHRGIRHVRIPTTTLAQNDSGVGVKNGVNAFGKKNFIGTFAPPFAVVNDIELLATLPSRDKRAGFAEAVKVSLIRDRAFFEALEQAAPQLVRFEPEAMESMIRRCAELHIDHITLGGDPFEMGTARPLDFGHWAAHKLEQLSGYRLRHGEAVAIGIAIDTLYSQEVGLLDATSAHRVLDLLRNLGFELFAPELLHADAENQLLILKGLEEFREHLGGELTITLLQGLGQGVEIHAIDNAKMRQAVLDLKALASVAH